MFLYKVCGTEFASYLAKFSEIFVSYIRCPI